ncbi:nuclear ubiquitous casein and cyclin-dependent kinase substrate 1-like isoform X2 [Actinia tenebrosa]|uniref:Nuclear ubiquitous casein and cyclin-dependent kinase substrate 1-like isoform X2 n=1 Tax=Actinia tenebrosa TaxID=6105 RepID=A0A6P8H0T9_ACTTE|nr:nuclear ubiquitous casein and cyclin-dependent kinase substrate 1-like isoform X2 [Actinia tenebrosa]
MSAARRSARAKKQVDYSLTDSPDNSDDDFQDSPSGPPPNKKPKTATKSKTKAKPDEKIAKEKPSSTRKQRLSLEEKMYQRELEAAIEASKKESQSSDEAKPDNDSTNKENEDREVVKGMSHEEVAASMSKNQEELDSKTPSSTEQEEDKSDEDDKEGDGDDDEDFTDDIEAEASDDLNDEDSDFDKEKEKKKKTKNKKTKGPEPVHSSPSKVGIKPRTSVTVTPIKMLKSQARKRNTDSSKGSSIKSISSADSGSASNSPQSYF